MRELIADALVDGIWAVDPDGRTLYANAAAGRLLGRTAAEFRDLHVLDTLDQAGRDQFAQHLADVAAHGTSREEVECVFLRPDGTPVPLRASESALYDENGVLTGFVYRLSADARQSRMLKEVLRSRAQLADAQAIARIGSWESDLVAETVTWSQEMYVILDMDESESTGHARDFYERVVEEDREHMRREFDRLRSVPLDQRVEGRIRRRDGSSRWVRVIGEILAYDEEGRPTRMGGTVQDIDDLKRAELELVDAVELNTLMQFMASAANEARTLEDALDRLRSLILAHYDWQRAIAFKGVDGGLEPWAVKGVGPEPTDAERAVAASAAAAAAVVFDETSTPTAPLVALPVPLGADHPVAVLVITARSALSATT